MKILMIWPEETYTMEIHTKIPKRWAYLGEIATYIQEQGYAVTTMDCLSPHISHAEVFQKIAKETFDAVILVTRTESVRSIFKIVPTIKEIAPDSKILVYGDVANYCPNFFKVAGIDAIVENGDWECGILDYLLFLEGKIDKADLGGVSYRENDTWVSAQKGKEVPDNQWSFPDISSSLLDKDLYFSLTEGEITISVSRGCPFNCNYCPAVVTFNDKDRRQSPQKIIDYILKHKHLVSEFKFFSPTFTLDVAWVKQLCSLLIENNCDIRWCATTRPNCLADEEMIRLMSQSGCYKLAIGVETLDQDSIETLGKFHAKNFIDETKRAFLMLKKYDIEVKALMMMGISGQTSDNICRTFDLLKEWGAGIRAASYSPKGDLRKRDSNGTLTIEDIERLDKMTYQHIELPGVSRSEYLQLIYNTEDYREILGKSVLTV